MPEAFPAGHADRRRLLQWLALLASAEDETNQLTEAAGGVVLRLFPPHVATDAAFDAVLAHLAPGGPPPRKDQASSSSVDVSRWPL